MQPSIKKSVTLSQLNKTTLAKLGVIAVYFFGSRSQGTASPLSDFDFGILVNDDAPFSNKEHALYLELYGILSSHVRPETKESDVIDIVFLQSSRVPLELKAYIITHGILLFDERPGMRAAIEERILLQYADFTPLRTAMSEALLARL